MESIILMEEWLNRTAAVKSSSTLKTKKMDTFRHQTILVSIPETLNATTIFSVSVTRTFKSHFTLSMLKESTSKFMFFSQFVQWK